MNSLDAVKEVWPSVCNAIGVYQLDVNRYCNGRFVWSEHDIALQMAIRLQEKLGTGTDSPRVYMEVSLSDCEDSPVNGRIDLCIASHERVRMQGEAKHPLSLQDSPVDVAIEFKNVTGRDEGYTAEAVRCDLDKLVKLKDAKLAKEIAMLVVARPTYYARSRIAPPCRKYQGGWVCFDQIEALEGEKSAWKDKLGFFEIFYPDLDSKVCPDPGVREEIESIRSRKGIA